VDNTLGSNPNKSLGLYSLFDDRFPWAFDWSFSQKDTASNVSAFSSWGFDEVKNNDFNQFGMLTSVIEHPNSLRNTMSMIDQDFKLFKTMENSRFKDSSGCGLSNWDYLPG